MSLAMSNEKTVLSPEEAERVEAEFRDALMDEHRSRQQAQEHREVRSKEKMRERERERQILAEEELKERVRAEFYKEQGYKLYTDSAGRQHWLTPEEYDWRMRIRARRDKNRRPFDSASQQQRRRLMMYLGCAALAVFTGLFLLL
mgnify:CR=1 FL=1